jgi:prepilin-type N-terminal cleavage/methylation domain-containing protein
MTKIMNNEKRNGRQKEGKGFTLVELLIATAILVITMTGILMSYLRCLELNEISKNTMMAVQAVNNRMEQIRSTPFTQIKANFNRISFPITGLTGRGVSYVDDTDPQLLQITVSASWRQTNGRIFGEDKNFNGLIEAGEDKNGNNMLDSTVEATAAIFQK